MKPADMKEALACALEAGHDDICKHIKKVETSSRTTGIEKAFANVFKEKIAHRGIEGEVALSRIGATNFFGDRVRGQLDCYIPEEGTAIEYKAVRLPRRHLDSVGNALYDLSQLLSDYLRLNRAANLTAGYIVIFVYGPLVEDAKTPGKLYRAFHNQMFVDFNVAKDANQRDLTRIYRSACRELEWDTARGASKTAEGVTAVKWRSLGAICIDCRG